MHTYTHHSLTHTRMFWRYSGKSSAQSSAHQCSKLTRDREAECGGEVREEEREEENVTWPWRRGHRDERLVERRKR